MSFNHPGLVKFSPNFDIFVGLEADDASFSGYAYLQPLSYTPTLDKDPANIPRSEFTTHFNVKSDPDINDGWIQRTFLSTAGEASGALVASNYDFEGHMKTSQGSVDLSVRPQLSLSLDIDNDDASSSKRDTEGLKARKVLTNSAYRINYYSPVILHWDEKGVDLMAHSLQYAFMRYTGGAFRN